MSNPQSAIIPEPSDQAIFMTMRAGDRSQSALREVARVLTQIPSIARSVADQDRDAKLVSSIAIGSGLWDALSPAKRPAGLRPFKAISSASGSAPSTGGDLLLHAVSKRRDLNFVLGMRLRRALAGLVEVADEVQGFRYLDGRDLTDFIDGTENPKGDDDRKEVALIGDEDADFAGGSYVFTQRYVHNLSNWNTIDTKDQERAIGRRKRDSEELSASERPPTAHIARVVMERDGQELEIVRHSFPYGTTSEHGLFFIAYCRTLDIPEAMLARMMGTAGDGLHDRLMDFVKAVTGANFFAPSLETLASLP